MYVSPISNNKYNYSFQANRRIINNESGKLLYRTTTYFFRHDIDWRRLSKVLFYKYKDISKVNVFCHACSNGMEPYSFVIQMLEQNTKDARKFFPVIAKDLDAKNIEMAQKGFLNIDESDFYEIKCHTRGYCTPYFDLMKSQDGNYFMTLKPKKYLNEKVHFEQGDILEDIDKMPKSNTILFCRNFWPYLDIKKQELLAQKLGNHFDSSSLVIIGDFDEKYFTDHILRQHGFYELAAIPRVYCKKNS